MVLQQAAPWEKIRPNTELQYVHIKLGSAELLMYFSLSLLYTAQYLIGALMDTDRLRPIPTSVYELQKKNIHELIFMFLH